MNKHLPFALVVSILILFCFSECSNRTTLTAEENFLLVIDDKKETATSEYNDSKDFAEWVDSALIAHMKYFCQQLKRKEYSDYYDHANMSPDDSIEYQEGLIQIDSLIDAKLINTTYDLGKQMREYGLPIREGDARYEYIMKLWEIYFEEGEAASYPIAYFLYDITQDGIPELWVHGGNGGYLNAIVKVYTYKNKKAKCIYEGSGISEFQVSRKENHVFQFFSHMGHEIWRKFTWNGRRLVTREFEVYDFNYGGISPKDQKFIFSLTDASYDDSIPEYSLCGGIDIWPILKMFDK